MNQKQLEIFTLCERLSKLLGDKEAIADLKVLYERHPEMFSNMQDVSNTIKEVVKEPEYIKPNLKAMGDKDFMAYKQLNDEKMGDVGIRNDKGTNVIFHANKKKISELDRLRQSMVGSPTSYTQAQSLDGLVQQNISSTAKSSITQNQAESQETNSKQAKIKALQNEVRKISSKNTQTKDLHQNKGLER